MNLAMACDHAGYELKEELKGYLISKGHTVRDFGTHNDESVDYPDYAHPMAKSVALRNFDVGISICGSGNGINMVTNKYKDIRAALCWIPEISKLAREHNDANICSIPARFISSEVAKEIVDIFLTTKFEGGRHQRRIDKIPIQN